MEMKEILMFALKRKASKETCESLSEIFVANLGREDLKEIIKISSYVSSNVKWVTSLMKELVLRGRHEEFIESMTEIESKKPKLYESLEKAGLWNYLLSCKDTSKIEKDGKQLGPMPLPILSVECVTKLVDVFAKMPPKSIDMMHTFPLLMEKIEKSFDSGFGKQGYFELFEPLKNIMKRGTIYAKMMNSVNVSKLLKETLLKMNGLESKVDSGFSWLFLESLLKDKTLFFSAEIIDMNLISREDMPFDAVLSKLPDELKTKWMGELERMAIEDHRMRPFITTTINNIKAGRFDQKVENWYAKYELLKSVTIDKKSISKSL